MRDRVIQRRATSTAPTATEATSKLPANAGKKGRTRSTSQIAMVTTTGLIATATGALSCSFRLSIARKARCRRATDKFVQNG
jgi:hypothetical protein